MSPAKFSEHNLINWAHKCLVYVHFWSCIQWVEQCVNLNIFNVEYGQNFASCASRQTVTNRISHSEGLFEKAFLKWFGKFKGRQLCLFLNKVAGCAPGLLIKKPAVQVFPVNFAKFFITAFSQQIWINWSHNQLISLNVKWTVQFRSILNYD